MAQTIASFDTAHSGAIQDAQLDYYGKRLATASADHSIRLWEVSGETPAFQSELKGHDGPVWQVCWAHPKFGNLLASGGYDKRVVIWKEHQQGSGVSEWQIVYRSEEHAASVNGVGWAPWEFGLHLACASSDGTVSIVSNHRDTGWIRKEFPAHANGVNAVSWGPATSPAVMATGVSAVAPSLGPMRLVTGGSDNQVKLWYFDESSDKWIERTPAMNAAQGHTDIVRDVSWRPNVGIPSNTIATCSEDKSVIMWTQETDIDAHPWSKSQVIRCDAPVWRTAWSVTGSVLAVASGDNSVTLYKEGLDGVWETVTKLSDSNDSGDTPQIS